MVERFAGYVSSVLIRAGAAPEKDRPFLNYGLFCLFSGGIQITLLLFLSLLSQTVVQVAIFTFFFGLLKRTIGGWHAKRHISCLVLFTTLALGCAQIGKRLTTPFVLPLTLLSAAIMWCIVWKRAPVEHPNNPQKPERLAELKQISRLLACGELAAIMIAATALRHTCFSGYPLCAAMGSTAAAIALMVPNALPEKQKGGSEHEKD